MSVIPLHPSHTEMIACEDCGFRFVPRARNTRYCSITCRDRAHRKRYRARVYKAHSLKEQEKVHTATVGNLTDIEEDARRAGVSTDEAIQAKKEHKSNEASERARDILGSYHPDNPQGRK